MRHDFVRGILESELLGKTIFCHLLTHQYAASISTQQVYDAVSKDVLSRWVYPIVPDNMMRHQTEYMHTRPNIYKGKGVVLSRSATLKELALVGPHTSIGDKSVIFNSVIGANCSIGANVKINNAYVFDNVTIEDGCELTKCIVGAGAVIKNNTVISRGCTIGFDVVVGPRVTLPHLLRVSATESKNSEDSDEPLAAVDLGSEVAAFVYVEESDDGTLA
jgi:translation initiation factor eIF-2B subunit epsilon